MRIVYSGLFVADPYGTILPLFVKGFSPSFSRSAASFTYVLEKPDIYH